MGQLTSSLTHELNQPLTSVVANAQAARRWLLGNPPNFPETMTSIERVLRDGRTADERMQHIRALFKRESFEKKEAKISVLVYEAIRLVREDSNKAEVPIDLQFDDDLVLHNQIGDEPFVDRYPLINNRDRDLPLNLQPAPFEFELQNLLINGFQ